MITSEEELQKRQEGIPEAEKHEDLPKDLQNEMKAYLTTPVIPDQVIEVCCYSSYTGYTRSNRVCFNENYEVVMIRLYLSLSLNPVIIFMSVFFQDLLRYILSCIILILSCIVLYFINTSGCPRISAV